MNKLWIVAGLAILTATACERRKDDDGQQVTVTNVNPESNVFKPHVLFEMDSSKITKLASGLQIAVVKEGEGAYPKKGQTVKVNYHGVLLDGTKFDSSFDRGQPFEFKLGQGQVIKGWDEGVEKLKVGSQAVLIIPSELGYGDMGSGSIPPKATLRFDIEVLAAY